MNLSFCHSFNTNSFILIAVIFIFMAWPVLIKTITVSADIIITTQQQKNIMAKKSEMYQLINQILFLGMYTKQQKTTIRSLLFSDHNTTQHKTVVLISIQLTHQIFSFFTKYQVYSTQLWFHFSDLILQTKLESCFHFKFRHALHMKHGNSKLCFDKI